VFFVGFLFLRFVFCFHIDFTLTTILSSPHRVVCWFPLPVVWFFVSVLTLHWHQDCPPLIVFFVGFFFLRFVFCFHIDPTLTSRLSSPHRVVCWFPLAVVCFFVSATTFYQWESCGRATGF
jgi:hypothetical protein